MKLPNGQFQVTNAASLSERHGTGGAGNIKVEKK
jgi:hypothetical protein